jgi:hypothetical protein
LGRVPSPKGSELSSGFGAYWVLVASCFVEGFMWVLAIAGPIQTIGITARNYGGIASRAVFRLNGIPTSRRSSGKSQLKRIVSALVIAILSAILIASFFTIMAD